MKMIQVLKLKNSNSSELSSKLNYSAKKFQKISQSLMQVKDLLNGKKDYMCGVKQQT
jgi:hypothetical protein